MTDRVIAAVKGFFSSLFDFSFREFITDKVVKVLYACAALYILVYCLSMFFGSIKQGAGPAFFSFFYSIVTGIILMMLARAFLEIVIVIFRIAENTEVIAGRTPRVTPFEEGVVITVEPTLSSSAGSQPEPTPEPSDTSSE